MEEISGNLVDIHFGNISPAKITIQNQKIVEIKRNSHRSHQFIIPGFVDAHIHIESTLLVPSEFARLALRYGTIACVCDPHEIANVLGIQGVEYMIENASLVPLKFYFGASPCVPATTFETSGASLGVKEIEQILKRKEVKHLSEVMNVPGVLNHDPELMKKIEIAKKQGKKIDGHAPGLSGAALKKYIASGIDTDHECSSFTEAKEKRDLGMKILVREGSAARNFQALFPLLQQFPQDCMFCTDDLRPDDLIHGHIDQLVRKSVQRGMDIIDVLRIASLNPIQHYKLEMGLLREGDRADFLIVDDLKKLNILATYVDGNCVYKEGNLLFPRPKISPINHFQAHLKKPEDFRVKAKENAIKVIEAIDGELITNIFQCEPKIEEGWIVPDIERDILKICIVNRYKDAPPAVGFIKNFGLNRGAIASSIAHDSHNIIAIGTSDHDLCKAVNTIIEHQGGIAAVDGKSEVLALPVAGLMSDLEGQQVSHQYHLLERKASALGSTMEAPFMTLSFMGLLVIPHLKLSDRGLFDGDLFEIIDLFVK